MHRERKTWSSRKFGESKFFFGEDDVFQMKEFRTTLIWNSLKVKPCFGLVKTEWKKHFQNSSIFSVHKSGALLVAGSGRRKGEPHPCQDGPFWWCLNKACPACTHGPRCKVSAMQYQDAWGQTRARPFAIGECLWCIKSWLEWCWMVLPHFTIFKVTYLSPWHSLNCHCLFFVHVWEPSTLRPKAVATYCELFIFGSHESSSMMLFDNILNIAPLGIAKVCWNLASVSIYIQFFELIGHFCYVNWWRIFVQQNQQPSNTSG